MPVIFISYRREDSAGHAGRLFDRLRQHFGSDRVFLDVVGIEAGVDFVETIDQAVGSCDVLLAVIGREWLTCHDKQGRRRLDEPNDFIRTEITSALKRNVRVVPVLVEGAEMPPTDELPEELKRLTRRQAVELRDSRWDADVEALIAALARDTAGAGKDRSRPAPPRARGESAGTEQEGKPVRRGLLWGIGALVAALIGVGVALSLWPPSGPKPRPVEPTPEVGRPREPEPVSKPTGGTPQEQRPEHKPEPQTSQVPDGIGLKPPPNRRIVVPEVVGAQTKKAMDILHRAGFEFTAQPEPSKEAPDIVLRQEPPAGSRVEKGTRVNLIYAVPIPGIVVPDVVGAHSKKAIDILHGAGLDFTAQPEPTSKEAPNIVLRQEPPAGTRVEKGTRVTIVYAVPIPGIAVPDVVGVSAKKAMDILHRAGFEFTAQREPSKEAPDTVLRQEPAAGSRAEKGTRVTIIYAVPVQDRVPDRVGQTTVYILADKADQGTAEKLVSLLRGLKLPAEYRISPPKSDLKPGKLFYSSPEQADLAKTIAGRAGDWLWKASGLKVHIAVELDLRVRKDAMLLTMPGAR